MDIYEYRRDRLLALIGAQYSGERVRFADATGLSESRIAQLLSTKYRRGEAFTEKTARKVEKLAGLSPMYFDQGAVPLAPDAEQTGGDDDGFVVSVQGVDALGQRVSVGARQDTTPIRAVKIKIQAGSDGFVAEPDFNIDGGYFNVPTEVIASLKIDPANLIITTFRGRSMEPMYFDGDKGLVDLSQKKPVENECFVVNWNGETLVKCLIKKSDGWCLYSFNRDFPSISVRSGHCSIIGMVVWQPARIVKGLL